MNKQNSTDILSLIQSPAFMVREGTILKVNTAAATMMIQENTPVGGYLLTGAEEYESFTEGCLYLNLSVCGQTCAATVCKLDHGDVFVLENDHNHAELQAMALAAEELRGPLADIMANAERLFPIPELNEDPKAHEQASRINRGLYQMLRIISNMSDTYRYSEEFMPKLETCNLCQLVRDIVEKSTAALSGSDINLVCDLPRDSIFCPVDSEKIERALYNMLSNALKYTPKGGTVSVQLTRRHNTLYLTVEDTGSGIAEQLQNSFHNRYQRAPGLEDSRHGIGLGMVLIQCAAAAHQGTVLVQQPGQGTRITMTLKIPQNAPAMVHSNILRIDYAGERDHCLIELSDSLPLSAYDSNKH